MATTILVESSPKSLKIQRDWKFIEVEGLKNLLP